MTLAEQRERNFKLSKVIIDYFGPSFFRGKKILDLGAGNGELANIFAKLGADVTCCDAREQNLRLISEKFPHIKTVKANLEHEFPFEELSFDLILSIDLLCHLKNYEKHINDILNASENIILETEILDSINPNLLIPIQEASTIDEFSFSGEGSLVSDKNIQNKLSALNAKFKRIDETKLNHGHFKYDWRVNDTGRKAGNRRLWMIRRDRHLVRKIEANKIIKSNAQQAKRQADIRLNENQVTFNKSGNGPHIEHSSIISDKEIFISKKDKRFVIIIPSYNNAKWCEKNILSALDQDYDNFRVVFTDDASSDDTFDRVKRTVENSPNAHKCTLTRNSQRKGALANLYNMIHSCDDDEIILTLDGDDWLPHNDVLTKLKAYYTENDIWMTYGQYANSTDGAPGVSARYPDKIVDSNAFRSHSWGASHLRTFYVWLFKKIKKEHFMMNGEFFEMTYDFAIMFPMLEMSGRRSKFISEILYIYNLSNPISDHRKNVKLQQDLDRHIRKMPKYQRAEPPRHLKHVGLMMIATGKYDKFVQALIESADKFFLNNGYRVTYYLFTDSNITVNSNRRVVTFPVKHRPFPYASMDRFTHFLAQEDTLKQEDYLYYVDVDCLFVDNIGDDIIGDLVGVRHCGYVNRKGPVENNPKSKLYVDPIGPRKYKHYYGGGMSGGKSENYLALARWCKQMIDKDITNGIIPIHHDETAINRYFLDQEPTLVLSPSYHYPQSDVQRYRKIWHPEIFQPKVLLLDKDHKQIRE